MHRQSDAAPFCDEVEVFGALFLKKSALSGKYRMLPYFSSHQSAQVTLFNVTHGNDNGNNRLLCVD